MTAFRTGDHMPEPHARPGTKTQARLFEQIARAISYIAENRLDQPELDDVARHIGMSPHHLQRTFSDWAGISPKKFLKAVTLEDAKQRLERSTSVLDAAFDAGLSGPGRLHDLFVSIDAVTPGEFKSRGDGMTFRYGFHPSPFGECLIVVNERGLTGISFVVTDRDTILAEQKAGWDRADWIRDDNICGTRLRSRRAKKRVEATAARFAVPGQSMGSFAAHSGRRRHVLWRSGRADRPSGVGARRLWRGGEKPDRLCYSLPSGHSRQRSDHRLSLGSVAQSGNAWLRSRTRNRNGAGNRPAHSLNSKERI